MSKSRVTRWTIHRPCRLRRDFWPDHVGKALTHAEVSVGRRHHSIAQSRETGLTTSDRSSVDGGTTVINADHRRKGVRMGLVTTEAFGMSSRRPRQLSRSSHLIRRRRCSCWGICASKSPSVSTQGAGCARRFRWPWSTSSWSDRVDRCRGGVIVPARRHQSGRRGGRRGAIGARHRRCRGDGKRRNIAAVARHQRSNTAGPR